MAGSLNYPYARRGLELQRHADSLAIVTVPVGVTETFLFRFISLVSYDVLGSCVHSVSSCFIENAIAYSELQEVKKYVPQGVADWEMKHKSFSQADILTPANFFPYYCPLFLWSRQALLAIHFISHCFSCFLSYFIISFSTRPLLCSIVTLLVCPWTCISKGKSP